MHSDLSPDIPSPPSIAEIKVETTTASSAVIQQQQEQHRHDRWAQGCQAIFAGFVASAHIQGLRPTITAFRGTQQYDMILSTLRCFDGSDTEGSEATQDKGERRGGGVEGWIVTLLDVLNREDNRYTLLSPHPTPGPNAERVLQGQVAGDDITEAMNRDWALTSRGKKMFSIRQDGRVASPQQGVPKWWNM